ncbi:hypothetical protein AB0K60_25245 [Thermopolyspora sp. NPDC052614]|uniref:hypothetical protein n=1 Tax=Thermopolyspora sp. NPDC052614 TaxID=3155682 RepID=UPI003449AE50
MNDTILGGDPRRLISHLALYGLAAICADAGHTDLRLSWTAGMTPRPRLTIDPDLVGPIVHAHAATRHWTQETIDLAGKPRGLMSPRLTAIADEEGWRDLRNRRHAVLDTLTTARADGDLRLLAALGEPCYWRADPRTGRILQDEAANRLEMQPRNNGAEFVRTRLSKIAKVIADRTPTQILDGLLGNRVRDEFSKNAPDGCSATGLDTPGPVDNAIVWCALWGISQTSLALQTTRAAVTSASVRIDRTEHLFTPLWHTPWHPARLRTILTSRPLNQAATAFLRGGTLDTACRHWLAARGVTAVITFPVTIHGSDKAPERRVGTGKLHPLGARP